MGITDPIYKTDQIEGAWIISKPLSVLINNIMKSLLKDKV